MKKKIIHIWDRFVYFLFSRVGIKAIQKIVRVELDNLRYIHAQSYFNQLLINHTYTQWQPDFGISVFEYKVFSQWGQDGIIQFLIQVLPISSPTFIEFGCSNYLESNTRFLLMYNNWSGLIIDGNPDNIRRIRESELRWRYNLQCKAAFVTKDTINTLIQSAQLGQQIGLLVIDIDGNDYHIWECIHVIDPQVVIIEYNAIFGDKLSVSIPYSPEFDRHKAHYSGAYFGASFQALKKLGEKKGYQLVYCNKHGNDLFFVRKDILAGTKLENVFGVYQASQFNDTRNPDGSFSDIRLEDRFQTIRHLPLITV